MMECVILTSEVLRVTNNLLAYLFLLPGSYRSRDEVQAVRKTRDPILSLREKLLDSGLADTDEIKVLVEQ